MAHSHRQPSPRWKLLTAAAGQHACLSFKSEVQLMPMATVLPLGSLLVLLSN
jgi:hypothetical protein